MIILKNDFYSSYTGSVKSGDEGLTKDLLLNQISDLIAYDEKGIIDLLNKVNIPTKSDVSDKKLVELVVDNIGSNEKLRRGLAYMIADNNDLLKMPKKVGANGKKVSKQAFVNVINSIAEGMKPVVSEFTGTEENKNAIKLNLANAVKNKVETSGINKPGNEEKKKGGNLIWWVLGLTAAGIGGYFLYKHLKNKKDAKILLQQGGTALPNQIPTPNITPATPAIVQTQVAPAVVPQATPAIVTTPAPVMPTV